MEESVKMLNEYKGGHERFPVAQDIVDEFVDKYKAEHPGQKFSDRNGNPENITPEDIDTLRKIGRKSINEFTGKDIRATEKWARKFYRELGTKSPFFRAWFGDWREYDTTKVTVVDIPEYSKNILLEQRKTPVHCKDASFDVNIQEGWEIRISGNGERNTRSHAGSEMKSVYGLANIRGLIENGILLDSEVHEHHSNNATNDMIAFDHKLYALGKDRNGTIGLYKITVEETFHDLKHPDEKRFHNLRYIEKVAGTLEGRYDGKTSTSVSFNGTIPATTYSVSDLFSFVNTFDENFSPNPVNPLLLNEDGTPKVFYHGTPHYNGEFTVFDPSKAKEKSNFTMTMGEGNYFATDRRLAEAHARRKDQPDGKVYETYLSLKNPYVTKQYSSSSQGLIREISEKIFGTPYGAITKSTIKQVLTDHKYDGIVLLDENDQVKYVVAYYPEQIKSATDNIGTFNREDPDIRYSDRETFSQQVDSVMDGTFDAENLVYAGTTPKELHNLLGIPSLPMLMTSAHVYSMSVSEKVAKKEKRYKKDTNYHDLTPDVVKKIPDALHHPVAIIKSNTDVNDMRFVVVTNMIDKGKRPIIVAVQPIGSGKYYNLEIPSNIFLSGYGKDNFIDYVNKAVKENRILYVSKKISK